MLQLWHRRIYTQPISSLRLQSGRLPLFPTRGVKSSYKFTYSAFRKSRQPAKIFCADGIRSLTTTVSTFTKGEEYEDAKSNVIDGCDRAGNSEYSDGGAGWMLRFR
jgi:hypothetical protein